MNMEPEQLYKHVAYADVIGDSTWQEMFDSQDHSLYLKRIELISRYMGLDCNCNKKF